MQAVKNSNPHDGMAFGGELIRTTRHWYWTVIGFEFATTLDENADHAAVALDTYYR